MSGDDGKVNLGPMGTFPKEVVIIAGVIVGALTLGFMYLLVRRQMLLCGVGKRKPERRESFSFQTQLESSASTTTSPSTNPASKSKTTLIDQISSIKQSGESLSRAPTTTRHQNTSRMGNYSEFSTQDESDIGSGLYNNSTLLPQGSRIDNEHSYNDIPLQTNPSSSSRNSRSTSRHTNSVRSSVNRQKSTRAPSSTLLGNVSNSFQAPSGTLLGGGEPNSYQKAQRAKSTRNNVTRPSSTAQRQQSTRKPKQTLLGEIDSGYKAPSGTLLGDDNAPLSRMVSGRRKP
jgi:hypothetical protein